MLIFKIIQIFVTWLLIVSLVGLFTKKFRVPYTLGLVLIGLLLAIVVPLIRERTGIITPEEIRSALIPNLILTMLVPPLVFEAAFHIQWENLRAALKPVLAFVIPGVILGTLLVGLVIRFGAGIALPAALVFGALISATDPVAVVGLFRTLGVPPRLVMLVEGESLFNDGTAIVLFNSMLGILVAGAFHPLAGLVQFVIVAVGGLLIGWVIGMLAVFVLRRVEDHLIEISLSLVLAYGAYLLADHFHVSGVLAVAAAGLVSGNVRAKAMPESSRERLLDFWEYAAFLANSFIFLLIGLTTNFSLLINDIGYILLAIAAVLLARAVVIYGLARFFKDIPLPFQHVLFWGGLRGAVSLALALSLTSDALGADLERLQAMAFGVVLFTLIVQGTTMVALVKRLKLAQTPKP